MAINPHHTIEEVNGVRCSVVEKNVPEDRMLFLKKVLEHNKLTCYTSRNEDGTFIIGVDNLLFNPVHSVYNKSMRTLEGKILMPSYWLQKKQTDEYYWNYK